MKGDRKIIRGRYYNCNGYGAAIVASVTEGIDWAAYAGGVDLDISEDLAMAIVAANGDKLSYNDAVHFFPSDIYPEVKGISYRR